MRTAWKRGTELTGLARPRFDITLPDQIEAALWALAPEIVINAAAYTAVDSAETDAARAFAVNAHGPGLLAQECRRRRIPLIHLSTDYVFDGASARPYRESDPIRPINAYGRSKAAGEAAVGLHQPHHIIVRTAWVYASHGRNFVRTILRLAHERKELSVVSDQLGSPTAAADIAAAIVEIVGRIAPLRGADADAAWGTYHFTASGETSWHGLTERILGHLERAGARTPALRPIKSADYPGQAPRPAYSLLDCSLIEQTFHIVRPRWQDGLDRVLDQLVPGDNSLQRPVIGGMQ
jgi:dTDP-4-dehydrorhamnose reductase